jgi:Domain of unknown function (DUF932)
MKQTIPKEVTRLFYPVIKVPATQHAPDLTFPDNKEFFIIAPNSENLVLNSCSEDYHLITNKELIMPFYEKLKSDHDLEVKVRWMNMAAFKLDFIFKDQKMKKPKVGDIFSKVSMINSYDSSLKYQFDCGFYKLICENGMSVPNGERIHIKTVHKSGAIVAVEKTIAGIEGFLLKANNIMDAYDPLIENKLRMAEAQARIQELVEEEIFPTRSVDIAIARLQLEANMGEEINDFLVYNAMNYALNNNPDSKMKITKIDETDRQVLDYLIAN